jgi:archaellum component FlaC
MGQALTPLMQIAAQTQAPAPTKDGAQAAQAAQPGQPIGIQVGPGGQLIRMGSPKANLDAARNARSELRNQLERLEEQRSDLSQELQQLNAAPNRSASDVKGLETRIANIDTRILDVEKQITVADANVAAAAGVPGSVVPDPPRPRDPGPPEEFWVLSGIFLFVVGLPLTIAYARRIWKKSVGTITALPQEIYDRFNRLDQAIDSVAIEVERVGEGQRYLTRVYADQQRALGAGPAERVESIERERERQARK